MEIKSIGFLTFKFERDEKDISCHHHGKVNVDATIGNRLPVSFKYYVNPDKNNDQSNYNNIVLGTIDKIAKLSEAMCFRKYDENYTKLLTIIHDLSHAVFGTDKYLKVKLLLKGGILEYTT